MLDVAQVFAWTRMFAGYARNESIAAAARETFDPGKPCALCRAMSRARCAGDPRAPAVPSMGAEKMVLVLERVSGFVAASGRCPWPEMSQALAPFRDADVPVPPPRSLEA
jgi:hypothetical protein